MLRQNGSGIGQWSPVAFHRIACHIWNAGLSLQMHTKRFFIHSGRLAAISKTDAESFTSDALCRFESKTGASMLENPCNPHLETQEDWNTATVRELQTKPPAKMLKGCLSHNKQFLPLCPGHEAQVQTFLPREAGRRHYAGHGFLYLYALYVLPGNA